MYSLAAFHLLTALPQWLIHTRRTVNSATSHPAPRPVCGSHWNNRN